MALGVKCRFTAFGGAERIFSSSLVGEECWVNSARAVQAMPGASRTRKLQRAPARGGE